MKIVFKKLALVGVISLFSTSVWAACAYKNNVQLKSLSNSFPAWKAVTTAMAECGNFEAELEAEFRKKQPDAFATNPALYQIGGVSNGTIDPLLDAGTIRPLDDLVKKYGGQLTPNQLIKIDGKIMAIAMMVNAQHLMYRSDILDQLGITVPKTYVQVLAAAEKIKAAKVIAYPLGGSYKNGWNLAEEFVNMYLGNGGEFFGNGNQATLNNAQGIASLEIMKKLTAYMDPEYLVADSTYVQQQFQQGKIAMANLWATRAAAMDDAKESQVVGKVKMASAPMASVRPASTMWWDGVVIAANISTAQAEAAFRVVMEGLDKEMVQANNDEAVWLIDGFVPGPLAEGAFETAGNGTANYPNGKRMGLMHTALGNGIADYLIGKKSATVALKDIEVAYSTAAKEAGLVK